MSTAYESIPIAGGDTSKPLAMVKRLQLIERYLRPSAKCFLDCGCGTGQYVLALRERFDLDAHGIEFDAEKVKQANTSGTLKNVVTRGDLQKIDFPMNSWDYALLNEVLEHVPDDRRAVDEVHRILKPGGLLFIFSPNRWFPFETHGVRLKRSKRPVPHWLPFIPYIPLGVGKIFFDYWARNYWQGELAGMVKASGFSILERTFVWMTFEDISGRQPWFVKLFKPWLRWASNTLEKCPVVNRFGVSQVLVCRK